MLGEESLVREGEFPGSAVGGRRTQVVLQLETALAVAGREWSQMINNSIMSEEGSSACVLPSQFPPGNCCDVTWRWLLGSSTGGAALTSSRNVEQRSQLEIQIVK